MNLQEFEALCLNRQSCRQFSDKPLDEELIREICRVALLAPSACNAQPWKLVAVTGEKRKEVAACMQGMGMNKFTSDAAAFIAVVEGKSNLTARMAALGGSDFTENDLGILTAHLVLAAESAGVASCILGWRNEKKLCEVLGLGKNDKIPEVVALGYPAEGYAVREKQRKPLDSTLQFVH